MDQNQARTGPELLRGERSRRVPIDMEESHDVLRLLIESEPDLDWNQGYPDSCAELASAWHVVSKPSNVDPTTAFMPAVPDDWICATYFQIGFVLQLSNYNTSLIK